MSPVTLPRTLAAAAVAIAVVTVLVSRNFTSDAPRLAPGSADPAPAQLSNLEPAAPRVDTSEAPAAATLRELNALSETYRNTTFLIAIRDSGFVCNELLGVYGGVNDSTTWTASCSQMLAYTVSVASSGALQIDPMLQHLDSVMPLAPPREPGGEPAPRTLPPRALPQPR